MENLCDLDPQLSLYMFSFENSGNVIKINITEGDSKNRTWYKSLTLFGYNSSESIYHCNGSCAAGYEAQWKDVYTENWDTKKSFICEMCSFGSYKVNVSTEKCIPCVVSMKHVSTCAYQKDIISFQSTKASIIFFFIGLGILLSFIVAIIFVRYRKTPFVRASNQPMSLVQLLAQGLLFLVPILFFGQPTQGVCTARPIFFGVLITVVIAITLTKTQKLFFIFQARIRVSKKQRHMSKTVELLLIFLMLLVQFCIAILSFVFSKSRVIESYDNNKFLHVIKCNTAEEFMIQLFYSCLLALMCMLIERLGASNILTKITLKIT